MLARVWSNTASHSLPVRMQNGTATWKRVRQFLTKLNILLLLSSSHSPWYLPKGAENLSPHKNGHMNVYSSFVHNCRNREATKMSLSSWMNKPAVENYLALKRNEQSSHEKIWRKLNAYYQAKEANLKSLPNAWFQLYSTLDKAKLVVHSLRHVRLCKAMEALKRWVVIRCSEEERNR